MTAASDIADLGAAVKIGGAPVKVVRELRAIWTLANAGDATWVDRLGYLGGDLSKDQAAAVRRIIETYGPAGAEAIVPEQAPVPVPVRVAKWSEETRRHSWNIVRRHLRECRHCGMLRETRADMEVNLTTGVVGRQTGRYYHQWLRGDQMGNDKDGRKIPDCDGRLVSAVRVGV